MGALNGLMDPKIELTAKDREKQAKRMAKDERKREKEERKYEKKARKHPEREQGPRKRKIKEVSRNHSHFQIIQNIATRVLTSLRSPSCT